MKHMQDVFDINKFNVFQDEENYYLFRALNHGDHSDMTKGITKDRNGLHTVRTDRERYVEENGVSKYSETSEISLLEMWEHIKIGQSKQTNCISLSSNANISLDYGQGYNEEYIVVKVPKISNNVFNAGQYILREIEKNIDKEIENLPRYSKIRENINKINNSTNSKSAINIILDSYKKTKKNIKRKYIKHADINVQRMISSRFDRKQYFSKEQQLEYDKIIAKLTILETNGILRNILPSCKDNTSLISTIDRAFSSSEFIHYKAIKKDELSPISKDMMYILSLIQQLREKGYSNDILEKKALEIIKINWQKS